MFKTTGFLATIEDEIRLLFGSHPAYSTSIDRNFVTIFLKLSKLFLAPAAFSQMEITDDGVKDRVSVSIYPNLSEGKAMLKWEEGSIDYIEIISSNGQYMPSIPVLDAASISNISI